MTTTKKTPGVPIPPAETEPARGGSVQNREQRANPEEPPSAGELFLPGPRHGFKRHRQPPSPSETHGATASQSPARPGLAPRTSGPRRPPSPAWANQHGPGAAPAAAALRSGGDWPARPSLTRSRPAHASLPPSFPLHPPRQGKNGGWARVAANGRRGAPG